MCFLNVVVQFGVIGEVCTTGVARIVHGVVGCPAVGVKSIQRFKTPVTLSALVDIFWVFSGMINKHADSYETSTTFVAFMNDTTITFDCWYAVHSLQVSLKTISGFQCVRALAASEREARPVFTTPVSMQFFYVVGIHVASLHFAVKPGMLVYVGPMVISVFLCKKTFVTISTFMNTVYLISMYIMLWGCLKSSFTDFTFKRAILEIGF